MSIRRTTRCSASLPEAVASSQEADVPPAAFQPRRQFTWTKLQQIAAFTADGTNVIEHEISTSIKDEERMTQKEPNWVRRHVRRRWPRSGEQPRPIFARTRKYDPQNLTMFCAAFRVVDLRDKTRYALYNVPKFIEQPGEWCLAPLEGGKTRAFYLLPEQLKDGQPADIGFPVLGTGILLSGPLHDCRSAGFSSSGTPAEQRRSRLRQANGRPSHITISDCEVRFVAGLSGISLNQADHVVAESNFIHQCPGWTVGIYVNRTENYKLVGNRLDKNSGSGIRHCEAKHGELRDNMVLNHFGMHSSGLNFYEEAPTSCSRGNYVHNTIAINRNAERITFRNNVIVRAGTWARCRWACGPADAPAGGRSATSTSSTTRSVFRSETKWAAGIFGQKAGSSSRPKA